MTEHELQSAVLMPRTSASALLAVAVAYGADVDTAESRLARELGRAIQPLRDVVTREEALDGEAWFHEVWD